MSTTHSPSDLDKKAYILQYNQIKGVKNGTIQKSQWNDDCTKFIYDDQIAEQSQSSTYKVAMVDP